ncbi:hypothetical protein HN588_00865 [Candidatus Bathyarchaeota archaeon]|jgi:hypothetical protein|nr:hypothetical protein [Candidatus Bathyarchaeota archaeon]
MTKLKEVTEALDVANRKIATLERRLKRFKDYEKDRGNVVYDECTNRGVCFYLEDKVCIYHGVCVKCSKKTVHTDRCKRCDGTSRINGGALCPACQGSGVDLA